MLSAGKAMTKKFETNADEIMMAGANAIGKMILDNPMLVLLEDELTSLIAMTAAAWTANMQNKED